jgi:hypothetical protein
MVPSGSAPAEPPLEKTDFPLKSIDAHQKKENVLGSD